MPDQTPGTSDICRERGRTIGSHGERLENHDTRIEALEGTMSKVIATGESTLRVLNETRQEAALDRQQNRTRWGNTFFFGGLFLTVLVSMATAVMVAVVNSGMHRLSIALQAAQR